jgi:hypothetical protein
MKELKIGQKIKFCLDGNWEGEGFIKKIYDNVITVMLEKAVKEIEAGRIIIVDYGEIVD